MLLEGHEAAVFCMKFNPAGDVVASGSFDKFVYLWNVRGDCENFMMLKGHKNAILELHWMPDGERLITASPDKTVRAWDAQSGLQASQILLALPLFITFFPSLPPTLTVCFFSFPPLFSPSIRFAQILQPSLSAGPRRNFAIAGQEDE